MFLISVWLIEFTRLSPSIHILQQIVTTMLKKVIHNLSLDLWLLFLQSFSPFTYLFKLICVNVFWYGSLNTFLVESMYPFSYVDVMVMVGSYHYLRNCISFISKQDNLCTVVGFFILPLDHIMQHVSFKSSNRSEESIPHDDGSSKR